MPWDRRKVHWLAESEWEKAIEALNEWCIVGCPDGFYLVLNPDYSVYVASGAETQLKQNPNLWKEMLLKVQTPAMLDTYDVIADSLLDNALYFFRDRIENAFRSRAYAGGNERRRLGKNGTIYERLDMDFSIEMALQHSVNVNGAGVSRNQVRQMLKNWKKQGLISQTGPGMYRKMQAVCH